MHHGNTLRLLTGDSTLVDALADDPGRGALGARSRALVTYALLLTRSPHAVTSADVHALRDAGLDDRGIHDLAAVTAYFNFVNRMAAGLGVDVETERARMSSAGQRTDGVLA